MDTFIEGLQSHQEDYEDDFISYNELKDYTNSFLERETFYLDSIIDNIHESYIDESIAFIYCEFPKSYNLLCHKIVMRLVMKLADLNHLEFLDEFKEKFNELHADFYNIIDKIKYLDFEKVLEGKYKRYTKAL